VAETQLNADSSRSHTVFTISLFLRDAAAPGAAAADAAAVSGEGIVNPHNGSVAPGYRLWSRMCIVDLAGSERQSRTHAGGARLREAGAINNSLMTLMKCFEAMRHNAAVRDGPRGGGGGEAAQCAFSSVPRGLPLTLPRPARSTPTPSAWCRSATPS
jgi:hypothetical protein